MQLLHWNALLIPIRGSELAHGGRKVQGYLEDFSGALVTPTAIVLV